MMFACSSVFAVRCRRQHFWSRGPLITWHQLRLWPCAEAVICSDIPDIFLYITSSMRSKANHGSSYNLSLYVSRCSLVLAEIVSRLYRVDLSSVGWSFLELSVYRHFLISKGQLINLWEVGACMEQMWRRKERSPGNYFSSWFSFKSCVFWASHSHSSSAVFRLPCSFSCYSSNLLALATKNCNFQWMKRWYA